MSNAETQVKVVKSSMMKRRVEKYMKNKAAVISIFVLLALILACVCAGWITPYDPAAFSKNPKDWRLPPSAEHLLGTDRMGRDVFARVLYGGQWSLFIGILASLCTNLLGSSIGVIAGYYGKKVDSFIVTTAELVSLFPTMLVLILISTIYDITIWTLIIMWTLTGWPGVMRQVRTRVMSLRTEPFIESCIVNGISKFSIMFHHIIPNAIGPVVINVTMNVAGYILSEASLSYLGYGLDSSIPTWGNLLMTAKGVAQITDYPAEWLAPGGCILVLVLCVNYIGDGLRDAIDATTR